MSDEDKPFVCSQPGCGMQFTNEDHLAVHIRKHDMSLALNLTHGNLSPLGLFTDQTPTPTKFLKNCEELGLFQELSKNPFDDSFKKAMDEPLDHVDNSLHLPTSESTDLDTPQPPVPKIVIGGEALRENRKPQDKPRDFTVSSIVPKKRKKFLSQTSLPTSTTSEDEEEAVIGSSTELTGSHVNTDTGSVLVEVSSSEPVQSSKRMKIQMTETTHITESEPVYTARPSRLGSAASPINLIDDSPEKNPAPVISSPAAVVNSVPVQSQPAVGSAPVMVQVMLQLPGGQMVPVQVPASNIAGSQQVAPKPAAQQGIQFVSPFSQTPTTKLTQNPPSVILAGNTLLSTGHNVQTVTPSGIIQNTVPITFKPQQQVTSQQTGLQTVFSQTASHPTLQTVLNQSGNQSALQTVLNQSGTQPAMQLLNQSNVQSALRSILVATANKQAGLQTVSPQNNASQALQNAISPNNNKTTPKVAIPTNQSYAKQRLKAAIQQQTTPSSVQKYSQPGEVKIEPQWSPGSAGSSANVSSPEASTSTFAMSSENVFGGDLGDNPYTETKREKFLERNRAAAARCRQKRKQWVQTLEKKSDDLGTVNNKLCVEIKKLRGEVANLKTMLLAHRDCPVTMQQRSQGHMTKDFLAFDNDLTDITPLSIEGINSDQTVPGIPIASSHLSTITPVDQSRVQAALPVPVALVSNVAEDHLVLKPMSVITGANSLGLIPKIFNLDPNSQRTPGGS